MSSRWLFRCNVANERETGDTEKARGLGHAMRCLALSRVVEQNEGDVLFSVEGADDVEEYFKNRGITCEVTTDHQSVVERFNPDVIVIDINYFQQEKIELLRQHAPVVNLAPRGKSKYFSDLTFTNAPIEDVPRPSNASLREWHAGPEFSILNPKFTSLRKRIKNKDWKPDKQGVVVQMGGVDQHNMTRNVIEKINYEKFSDIPFQVIAGPFNPHVDSLREYCNRYENLTFKHDPDNYAKLIASHRLGIFGTGISTFEGMAVGVPSINLGLSTFHDLRGKHLEKQDLGFYLGRYDDFDGADLNEILETLLYDGRTLENVRKRVMNIVDGRACKRIYNTVRSYLNEHY